MALGSLYAAAWAGLAYAYLVLPEYSPTADVERVRSQSESAAGKALDIDLYQPDALTAAGWVRAIHHYDWEGAEERIARAGKADSTNVNALHWQSHVVSWQGPHDEAIAPARRATELDPLSAILRQNLAFILMEAGPHEEALRELERVLSTEPSLGISYRPVSNINTRMGRYDEAGEALESWLVSSGRDAVAAAAPSDACHGRCATRFARTGQPRSLPRELVERLQPGVEVAGQLCAAVGEREATLELLEQAHRERAGSCNLLSMRVNSPVRFRAGRSALPECPAQGRVGPSGRTRTTRYDPRARSGQGQCERSRRHFRVGVTPTYGK